MNDLPDITSETHQGIFDAIPGAVYVTRAADGMVLMVSTTAEATLGYTRSEMVGRSVAELDLWADRHQRAQMIALLEADGGIDAFTARTRRRDGQIIDLLMSIQAIDIGGQPCLITLAHDVTERTRAETALRRSEQRLRQITESIDEGFLLIGVDPLRVLYASPTYAELLGTTVEAMYADPEGMSSTIHPDDQPKTQAASERMAAGLRSDEIEARVRTTDGAYRWVRFHWNAVDGEDEHGDLVASVAEDITDRKRAEREVALSRAQAEEASRAKSTFLSRVSHELRTPLNVILGFGQLLEIDDLRPEQHEALNEIMTAGRHLLHLVDEVLDISRAEDGTLDLVDEAVPVGDVVRQVMERLAPGAARRGIEVRHDGSCAQTVRGDRRRLVDALRQIVDNAIVHNTTAGSVDVRCELRPGGRVRILVEDSGPGLSPEDLQRVYLPFERSQGSGGTGLGLPMARRLVEAMGGEIGASSIPGRGSQFWIDLETASPSGATPVPDQTPTPLTRRVLYIEDNPSNAELATRAVQGSPGTSLVIASRGEEGLALLTAEPFDLVLLDLHLPDLSGEEILEHIRADAHLATLPVVVISADASPDVIARVLAAGAVDYLTKPINIAQLLRVIERRSVPYAMTRPTPAPPPEATSRTPPPPPDSSPESAVGRGGAPVTLDEGQLESLQLLDEIEPGTIHDLVRVFARAGAQRVEEMEQQADGGSTEDLAELAHALRGSAANLGAAQLATVSRQLEAASREGDTARVLDLVREVRRLFDLSVTLLLERYASPRDGDD